jgi:hypothetical protein
MDNGGAYAHTDLKGWRRHVILEKPVATVLLDEVASAPGAEIEARFHSDAEILSRDGFALLKGVRGLMALIPVSAGRVSIRTGSHSYRPVKQDAETVLIPYVGSVVRAAGETTRLATIIVPVADEREASAILRSVKASMTDDRPSISFTRRKQTYRYSFAGVRGLVLEAR